MKGRTKKTKAARAIVYRGHIGFSRRFACTLSHGFSALDCARSRYPRFTTAEPGFHRACFVGSPQASAMACAPPRRSP